MKCLSAAVLRASLVAQTNGAIFLWEPLAEWAINRGHVGRGQNFVRRYSYRFAGVTTKLTPMLVQLQPLETTSPTLGRVELDREVETTLAGLTAKNSL
jgi:hypothetical protein